MIHIVWQPIRAVWSINRGLDFISVFIPSFSSPSPVLSSLLSSPATMSEPEHLAMTYNDIHKLIRASSDEIAKFKPDTLIAIGKSPEICPESSRD